jgi:hypothetical protein
MDRRASQRLFGVDLSGAEAGIVEIQAIEDLVVVVARRGDWVARELPGVGALEEQDGDVGSFSEFQSADQCNLSRACSTNGKLMVAPPPLRDTQQHPL